MASSCEKLDQLVKDYLLFRGFTGTLKMLDQELKADKDKGLRVDRMMDHIWALLAAFDLNGLREYWRYLNQRLFSRLDQRYTVSVRKLESSLLKLYLINAHQCGKQEKVRSFFEVMGPELQSHPDFKEWFAFPFVSNPTENPAFSHYFNKQWQDTLQLSLHNFLSVILQAMPVPTLLNVEFDARRMKTLQEENTHLKERLRNSSTSTQPVKEIRSGSRHSIHSDFNQPASPLDMVYDFSGLAEDVEPQKQPKPKPTKRFGLNITSPLKGRKNSDSSHSKSKASAFYQPSNAQVTGMPSTSANIASKTKTTEMSTFPPPSTKAPTNEKKSSSTVMGGASYQPQQGASSGVSSGFSPAHSRGMTPAEATSFTVPEYPAESPAQPGTNRSYSVPGDTVAKATSKSIHKQSSEGVATPTTASSTVSYPATASVTADYKRFMPTQGASTAGVLEHSFNETIDAESPFLTLEDEYMEHNSAVSYCRFGPTGQYIASLDIAGIVKVWTWSPQPATSATIMSKSAFLSLAWMSKTERFLLLGNKSGSVRLFDVKESKTHKELQMHPDNPENCLRVNDICMSPLGNHFVCATSNLCPLTSNPQSVSGKLMLWDIKSWKSERSMLVNSDTCNAITCSCFSPGGYLVTGGSDGFLRLYDCNQAKPMVKWRAHDGPIHSIQFQGKDSVYSVDGKGKLCEWTLSQPGHVVNFLNIGENQMQKNNSGRCRSQLFSFDREGKYLLTYKGHKGAIYRIQGKSSPVCVMELKAHPQPVVTVDWSPSLDTQVCLTGSIDGRVKISTLLSK